MPLGRVANDRLRHMLIGYARVSKADGSQSLDLPRDVLRAAGIDDAAHVLVVWTLDRPAGHPRPFRCQAGATLRSRWEFSRQRNSYGASS